MRKHIGLFGLILSGYFFNTGLVYVFLLIFGWHSFGRACLLTLLIGLAFVIVAFINGFLKGAGKWFYRS